MDIKTLSPSYAVSPQIAVEDIPAIVAAGFKTIICNRPDAEVPPSHQAAAIRSAAETHGLAFVDIPVTHMGLNEEMVAAQKAAIGTPEAPTLAYCASGNRSSIVWGLAMADSMSADEIIAATDAAGYNLGGLRPQLEAMGQTN
ncbi:TIGR01244 family sulfur transferase [Yoonia sediminilitoris]|uniref:Uncharacterized protein (TIGR01244 family) n=1 Tax=Yoonia sediminilitoris TaxID=1286148 RepID=A0A2T6KQP9_9RHOB|nr:TIGR01244 family sulfur transferase [Yoonia sediminilitoris]PUB18893.1 uncharacterized protein (TIGR01244 family) [Yoonia sediminilitoris]RCW99061.1 uncharacterized protein (TIGR01244 family) [Yoonia sediminilitoris]